jgi:hypothetical protein
MKTVPGVTGEVKPAKTRLVAIRLAVIELAVIELAVIGLAVIELAVIGLAVMELPVIGLAEVERATKREVVRGDAREDVPAAIAAAGDVPARDVPAGEVPTKADAAELADVNNEKRGFPGQISYP